MKIAGIICIVIGCIKFIVLCVRVNEYHSRVDAITYYANWQSAELLIMGGILMIGIQLMIDKLSVGKLEGQEVLEDKNKNAELGKNESLRLYREAQKAGSKLMVSVIKETPINDSLDMKSTAYRILNVGEKVLVTLKSNTLSGVNMARVITETGEKGWCLLNALE